MLAKALSGHPQLVMRSEFPYETRTSQHLFNWAANGRNKKLPYIADDGHTKYRLHQKDDRPSEQWFSDNITLVHKNRAIDIADNYYKFVAELENKNNPTAYVEKAIGANTVNRMHRWGWPLKRILLIRDPRDILLSVNSFNEKNNTKGFGADRHSERELLNLYINFFLNNRKVDSANTPPGIEIKYEALKNDPEKELTNITAALGLDSTNKSITQMLDTYNFVDQDIKQHRTQTNINNVVRWPSEATDNQLDMFHEFDEKLQLLDYAS